jgi:hypothetical protein
VTFYVTPHRADGVGRYLTREQDLRDANQGARFGKKTCILCGYLAILNELQTRTTVYLDFLEMKAFPIE